jgi:hypothetical protein
MSDSILQSEKECFVTGATRGLDKHHIYHGPRRKAADKWGCWVWLAHDVHMDLHERNPGLDRDLKDLCQRRFEELYGHEKFMTVFGKNYLKEGNDDV